MISHLFRAVAYVMFGLTMEVIFSVVGIEMVMGTKIPNKRLPKQYLEGFVSLYMIPLYLWIAFLIAEPQVQMPWQPNILIRYIIWAVALAGWEAVYGFAFDAYLGDYPWSYYALSKYKVFKRGYTLWTLVPLWGFVGLIIEQYVSLILYLSPIVEAFVQK